MENNKPTLREQVEKRRSECIELQRAYESYLKPLTGFRWLAIAFGVVLPAIAGAAFFADWLGYENWKIIASAILVLSGIVSGLHTGFRCDAYQLECFRLIKEYKWLAVEYEDALSLDDNALRIKSEELKIQFGKLQRGAEAYPSLKHFEKARIRKYLTQSM